MAKLFQVTMIISGPSEVYDDYEDEMEDTVEAAIANAQTYILQKFGQLGIGPVVVSVEM